MINEYGLKERRSIFLLNVSFFAFDFIHKLRVSRMNKWKWMRAIQLYFSNS